MTGRGTFEESFEKAVEAATRCFTSIHWHNAPLKYGGHARDTMRKALKVALPHLQSVQTGGEGRRWLVYEGKDGLHNATPLLGSAWARDNADRIFEVVPAGSPNVLPKEEALLLIGRGFDVAESLAELPALLRRLSEWAESETPDAR